MVELLINGSTSKVCITPGVTQLTVVIQKGTPGGKVSLYERIGTTAPKWISDIFLDSNGYFSITFTPIGTGEYYYYVLDNNVKSNEVMISSLPGCSTGSNMGLIVAGVIGLVALLWLWGGKR